MGNVVGRQQEWVPNIVAGPQNNNDLNNPVSNQVRSAFISFAIPTAAMVLFANAAWRFTRERQRLQEEHLATVTDLKTELEQLRAQSDAELAQHTANHRINQLLSEIDKEETVRYWKQIRRLDWYDDRLKDILDIRCSAFRHRKGRIDLENNVMEQIATDETMKGVNIYQGVRDVINHDFHFCGGGRDENGKFRQLYMQVYRQKLQLNRQRAILERLKKELKSGN